MNKDELALIIGGAAIEPIELHLHAIATESHLPLVAIATCLVRTEEAGPPLLSLIDRAADGEVMSADEAMLLFRGLYILGGARYSPAFKPLLRLLRNPDADLDFLLGDAVTQNLAQILAGVFDGDADALFAAIADTSLDEFVREALWGAAAFLTWDGRIDERRTRLVMEQFYAERLAEDGDSSWVGWLEAIARLGWRDLAPLVHRAWDEGRIAEWMLERRHFEQDLLEAEQSPGDIARFKAAHLGYIDDVIEALEWTLYDDESDYRPDGEAPLLDDRPLQPPLPVTNPFRHVGRNDPCPCGSGKKHKKCCLAA